MVDTLFDRLLHESPSVFGRLVRGVSLREPSAHLRIFRLWLDLPLREQRADLRRYLSAADAAGNLPHARQHCDYPAALVPESANSYERELFLRDMQLALAAMANDGCALEVTVNAGGALAALWHWRPKWRTTGQPIQ